MSDPIRNLYKVTVEVDICVLAQNSDEAIRTAKESAPTEIQNFSTGQAYIIL